MSITVNHQRQAATCPENHLLSDELEKAKTWSPSMITVLVWMKIQITGAWPLAQQPSRGSIHQVDRHTLPGTGGIRKF